MELSIDLALQIASMVLICLVGFVLTLCHIVTTEESRVLSRVCVYVVIPCSIFNAFQYDLDANRLSGLALASLAAVLIHGMYLLVTAVMNRTPLALTREEQASTIYNNAGNLVIPMIYGISSLGAEYVFYTSAYIAAQNLLIWTHGQSIMGGSDKINWRKIFLNPCMISIFLSISCFFLQIRISGPISVAVTNLAACIGPLSMLVIGMMLGEQNLKQVFTDLNVYRVSAIRLIFFPLLSIGVLVGLSHIWSHPDIVNILTVSLLCATGPAAATISQLAQLYDNPHKVYVSAINVVSTMLCAITMPIMAFIFQALL